MLGNGDLILMTGDWPHLIASRRHPVKSLSHLGHSDTRPLSHHCTIHENSTQKKHLEFAIKPESLLNNWKRPKPQCCPRTSLKNACPAATWSLFLSHCRTELQKVAVLQVCASHPPSRWLVRFCILLLAWSSGTSFLVSQAGQRPVSQRGTDITLPKNIMMGKTTEKLMTGSHIKKLLGAFKCPSNNVTCFVLDWFLKIRLF